VNFFNRAPIASNLVKKFIGVAPQREMPGFANETFKAWFARNKRWAGADGKNGRVILWPDTFNNFFHPETAKAAVEVLENAGFGVVVPSVDLCCGRPLYDYGMLDTARRWLRQILRELKDEIEAGTPVIGLEPSCTAVFRDELVELFPQNQGARRLCKQTFTLAEFLQKHAPHYELPKLQRTAVLHGHCHEKAVLNFDCEKALLKKMGLDLKCPETGCCGMAGAFGFEKEHLDVSLACGERILLPAVREVTRDTLIVADGFSCREQVRQMSDRVPLHFAQVVKMAIDEGPRGPSGNLPEQNYITQSAPMWSTAKVFSAMAFAVLGLTAIAGLCKARRPK
jgi:Fe-S oxidoreductase